MGRIPWPTKEGYLRGGLVIRLIKMGCKNRPFYQIGVTKFKDQSHTMPVEVIGNIDTMPNERDELVAGCDLKRLVYWIGKGAKMSPGVESLLGLAGFMPIAPQTYIKAFNVRQRQLKGPVDPKELEPTESVLPLFTRLF